MKSRTSDRPKNRVTSFDPSKNSLSPTLHRSGDTRSWSISLEGGGRGSVEPGTGKVRVRCALLLRFECSSVHVHSVSGQACHVLGRMQLDIAVPGHGVLHQHLDVVDVHGLVSRFLGGAPRWLCNAATRRAPRECHGTTVTAVTYFLPPIIAGDSASLSTPALSSGTSPPASRRRAFVCVVEALLTARDRPVHRLRPRGIHTHTSSSTASSSPSTPNQPWGSAWKASRSAKPR
jgi:hypothetical protein